MRFQELKIRGAYLIAPDPYNDERGIFCRRFCVEEFAARGIETAVAQSNTSYNRHGGTLRGFHYQCSPYEEAKTIACLRGEVYAIIVDLRLHSATYKSWEGFVVSEWNDVTAYHVPKGCATAFLTRTDDVLLSYFSSTPYTRSHEAGIRWNDPAFGFHWPATPKVISERDQSFPDYQGGAACESS